VTYYNDTFNNSQM